MGFERGEVGIHARASEVDRVRDDARLALRRTPDVVEAVGRRHVEEQAELRDLFSAGRRRKIERACRGLEVLGRSDDATHRLAPRRKADVASSRRRSPAP
ncbi:MAG: hypothetical protein H6721_31115 [Sandaracinus sp.]|nr:hypothetical protein [Sandaracinus sp.]